MSLTQFVTPLKTLEMYEFHCITLIIKLKIAQYFTTIRLGLNDKTNPYKRMNY